MTISTFASRQQFRKWLEKNHRTTPELLVRCYKVHAGDKGLTYREALDEALCFGWIDGVRRSLDEHCFSVRFTPRKPKSTWSRINIRRAGELKAEGRMHSSGRAAYARREAVNPRRYSYESGPRELDASSLRKLRANKPAWAFFRAQPTWYQRTSAFWVMEAKREETRERRLAELIARSARGEPIKLLDRRAAGGIRR
jgi:uncharacterized protein YdeI (YjbR/CyaY-like superfamily)